MWHTLLICDLKVHLMRKVNSNDDHRFPQILSQKNHWNQTIIVQMNRDDLLLKPEKNRKRRSQRNVKYLKMKEKLNYLCVLSNERIYGIQKQSICQLKHVNG